jgi:hypothetical protein
MNPCTLRLDVVFEFVIANHWAWGGIIEKGYIEEKSGSITPSSI